MSGRRVVILALLGVAGCDLSDHDMGKQPTPRTYRPAEYFADGASARPFVAGTVSRDVGTVPGTPYAARHVTQSELETNGATPRDLPVPVTRELLERGQLGYTITCSVCHGRLGSGDGMIVQRGLSRPPSLHAARLVDAPDSHVYDVITQGYGAMYSYNDRLTPEQRWAVVAYVRALQAAGRAAMPDEARASLNASYDPNRPTGGAR